MELLRKHRFVSVLLPLALFALVVFTYCFNALKEPDAYYHLKSGQVILETLSIPHADIFSYTAAGAPWVAHEWLAQIMFYSVYSLGGYWLLMAFVATLSVIAFGIVARVSHRKETPLAFTLLGVLFLCYLTFELWIPRPQIFAFLLCAVLVYLLEQYRKRPRTLHLGFAALTMLIWANVHASFVLGLVLLGWYLVSQFAMHRWKIFGTSVLSKRNLVALGITIAASTVLCLLNPTGYHAFLYWHTVQTGVNAFNVFEWRSIIAFRHLIQAQVNMGLFVLGSALAIYWYGYRKASRDFTSLGMVIGITILPFISIRHIGFWVIAAVPFLVPAVGSWLAPQLQRFRGNLLTYIFIGFAVLLLLGRMATFPRQYFIPQRIPVYAVDFIERVGLKGPLFNLYNEGGYLIWRLYPQMKVAIDGRSEVYTGQSLADFFGVMRAKDQWTELVDEKYKINFFFLAYNPHQLRTMITPIVLQLRKEGWVPVYWDDVIIIYVRNSPENADIIKQYGMKVIDPFSDPTKIPQELSQAAADEFQRVTTASPIETIPLEYARLFLLSRQQGQ